MKARVLLADDHPRFPEMEARLLEPEFEVVGKVGNGQALIEEAMRLKPDIIITDISMPILDGIEAVERLKKSGCASRIVFLSVHSDTDFVTKCLSTGALGYVLKSRIATELVPAIRHALAGNTCHIATRHNTSFLEVDCLSELPVSIPIERTESWS